MEKAAVSNDGLVIPLIDLSKFLHGTEADRVATAKAILNGFQSAGFIYLKNTPITPEAQKAAFAASARFFALPTEKKDALGWTTPEANRGYTATGREKVSDLHDRAEVAKLKAAVPDLKESIEIGREDEDGCPNRWPDETDPATRPLVAGFRHTMNDFHAQCKAVHEEVMRAIAVGMGLPATFFDAFVDVGDNTLRLLHYPAVSHEVFARNPGQVRAGEHSDYGSITLLFQDSRGGLQVRSPNGNFVDATPIENTIVVNAGDLLARWSNDTIKSTIHRVVEPPTSDTVHPARYSIAYFCNPNFKSFIEVLPGTFGTEAEKKYEPVTTGNYIIQRLAATY
ncbi:2og-Fe oxygenase family protein [Grosmannia clavigera kw1407]|uniref:2og-Fe oxygenase family protein n=1 Tax=Grosmannia clavigera (strain kw1407 / UAMH 11150) TaxID=655863 RepID=F0XU93_GROCL|nr:2og-Fe oxygenase family protein [Grosmannia clavigera kw1407]EFW98405.1 2og-Fe oxygenase family protein [Grosmannia clavigera kw1407]